LQQALLRLSNQQGLDDEYRGYQQAFHEQESNGVYERRELGELVLVVNSGLAPVKREAGVTTFVPGSGQLVRVSVPNYVARRDDLSGISVLAKNRESTRQVQAHGELVQNIDNIAFKTLEAEMPGILARSAARVVAKYQVTREISRQDNALGILSNVFNILTERADTRSWLTLPKTIYLVRVALEPGNYDINLEFLSAYGLAQDNKVWPNITVNPGETKYISYHRVPAVALSESANHY
jgi:hypothetical protein